MNRGMPSMAALLGLLAVAGYQNRDKIAEVFRGTRRGSGAAPESGNQPADGMWDKLGGLFGGATAGSVLSGGLGDLLERFRQDGQGAVADSWVKDGPNQPLRPDQLEHAIGPETLSTLSQHTGLSREELIARLTRDLPAAVDRFTPEGRVPTEEEAARLL